MNRLTLTCLAALVLTLTCLANADVPMPPEPWPEWGTGSVELVNGDQPRAVVVVAENPTRAAQVAAAELVHYVRKMTGVELPIQVDGAVKKHSWQPRRILVGESRMTQAYGLHNRDFEQQEYLIATRGQDLVLMGRDAEEYGLISYDANGLWPTAGDDGSPLYTAMGSLYAVDTFLERVCGVRWYLPEDIGEVCPRVDRLIVGPIHRRERPWTRYRSSSRLSHRQAEHFYNPFAPSSAKRVPQREMTLWLLRLKIGGQPFHAGHAYTDYFEAYGEQHPEWWKEGKPTSAWPHPDYANPELIKATVERAKAAFERGARYYSVTPNDGRKGLIWSERGEALRREDPPDLPETFSCGWASNFVFSLANQVARGVREAYPDRYIAVAAYAPYFLPPDAAIGLEPNIAVCQCGNLHESFTPERFAYHADNLTAWSKLTDELYIWEWYLQQSQAGFRAFPVIFPHQVAWGIKHLQGVGGKGMFFEASAAPSPSGHYTDNTLANPMEDLLNHYVTWKLLVDPDADVNAVLAEHYRLFYGPASGPMSRFYAAIEARWQDPAVWETKVANGQQRFWEVMYSDALAADLTACIDQARNLAAADPYRAHVDLADRAILQPMKTKADQYRLQFAARPRLVATPGDTPPPLRPEGDIALAAAVADQSVSFAIGGVGALAENDQILLAFDPGRGRDRLFLLTITPGGTATASLRQDGKPPKPWEAEAEIEVMPDAPWSVTVTLPLLAYGQPSWGTGDVWGVNAMLQRGDALLSWAPIGGRPDDLDELGVMSLGEPGMLRYSFDNWLTDGVRDQTGGKTMRLDTVAAGKPWGEGNVAEGRVGGGIRFLGKEAGQFLQINIPPAINTRLDDFTLALWYRSASPGGLLFGSTTTAPYYQFYPRGSGGDGELGLCFALNAGHEADTSVMVTRPAPELVDKAWHHYALVVDRGRNARVYVDGKLLDYRSFAGQRGSLQQLVTIGGPYNYLTGDIDDVVIRQGALDIEGVKALMTPQPTEAKQ